MVSDTRDNPSYRGNFIERLYEKKLSLLTDLKFTQSHQDLVLLENQAPVENPI